MPPDPHFPGRRFLHSPGPTHVPDEVMVAMSQQPMDLADPRVAPLIAECESGLARLMDAPADAKVFLYAGNGHGAWEAVIANVVRPGGHVLVAGTGHFSEGWALQTEACGGRVTRTPWIEGKPIDPNTLANVLRADTQQSIDAVFVVHTDTASSVTNDLAAISEALRATGHRALLVVDVVASLGAAPFSMRALGAHVVLGASQKGLMTHPGLAFVAADAKARDWARTNPGPRFYWDWERRDSDLAYRKFCGTAPYSLIQGLRAALARIEREGLDQVLARHAQLAQATQASVAHWAQAGALGFFAQDAANRSVSVTSITTGPGVDPEVIRHVARERFQVAVAGGLGPLAGRIFRIGHLGDLNAAMLLGCLAGVEAALRVCGVPHRSGGVEAAIEVLTRPAPSLA